MLFKIEQSFWRVCFTLWDAGGVMERERWTQVYEEALLEVTHAKMRGRIADARAEIVARVEKLKGLPGLHTRENQAIDDALSALRFLEREEERFDQNQRRETLELATRRLQTLAPRIRKYDASE
jgi:hypothetical protein